MLNFETRHVSMISVGQGSQPFSFPSYVLRFWFHQKINGFRTKKTSLPNQPNQPQVQMRSKKQVWKRKHPPTNQPNVQPHTNQPFGRFDLPAPWFPSQTAFSYAFSRWSLTTSTTCPVESLWGADSICTAELVYSVLGCSEFLTDKRNIQILGGWIVWKISCRSLIFRAYFGGVLVSGSFLEDRSHMIHVRQNEWSTYQSVLWKPTSWFTHPAKTKNEKCKSGCFCWGWCFTQNPPNKQTNTEKWCSWNYLSPHPHKKLQRKPFTWLVGLPVLRPWRPSWPAEKSWNNRSWASRNGGSIGWLASWFCSGFMLMCFSWARVIKSFLQHANSKYHVVAFFKAKSRWHGRLCRPY